MDAAVGRLIPLVGCADRRVLDTLDQLCGDQDLLRSVGARCRDPRFRPSEWESRFHREVLWLFSWVIARRLALERPTPPSSPDHRFSEVLTLMPRHGLAAHVLRRAVPFAAMGIPTEVGFADDDMHGGSRIVRALGQALGIGTLLTSAPETCVHKVRRMGSSPGCLTVVTGQERTVGRVRAATRGPTLGATGRCSVLVGTRPSRLRSVRAVLRAHHDPRSCTHLAATFIGRPGGSHWSAGDRSSPDATEVRAALREFHPSVVFVHDEDAAMSSEPGFVHGYRMLLCDDDGTVADARGFGADPIHGWPGDFLL